MMLRVTVKPNARADEVLLQSDGSLLLKIKAPPVDGKANKYLEEFMAKWLGIAKSRVAIVKGTTSTHKTLAIDIEEQTLKTRLEGLNPDTL
jgi:uncharacterized protein (TIGR00251 family)